MNQQEKLYQDGFNSGYFLAQHEPELASIILDASRNAKSHNEYVIGLSTGHDVYISKQIMAQNKEAVGDKVKTTPEKKNPEKDFQKGFNSGYSLSKHEPELAKLLITPQKNPGDYHKGLTAGKREHEMEKVKDRLKGMSKGDAPKKEVKSKGKEK